MIILCRMSYIYSARGPAKQITGRDYFTFKEGKLASTVWQILVRNR